MANILPFLHFTAFLTAISLSIFIVLRNRRALLNRLGVLLIFPFALWSFGYCSVHLSTSTESAMFWINFSSIGWITFPIIAFYFYLALTGKNQLLKSKALLAALVLITAFFIYQQWSGHMVDLAIRKPYGWSGIWSQTIYTYLYFAFFSIFCLACICLTVNLSSKANNVREKHQARLLSITAIISLILGSTTDVILPITSHPVIPQIADIFVMIWELGIVISVTKYGLMSLTPTAAADQILSTMTDSLMLLDTSGVVKLANPATIKIIEKPEKELIGTNFDSYVLEKDSIKPLLGETLQHSKSINRELTYLSASGKSILVQVSISRITDNLKTVLGFVVVARDITERKMMEERIISLYQTEKKQRQDLQEETKARGLFIDVLAHEMRTPLTPIIASTGMLYETYENHPDSIQKKLAINIYNSTQTLATRLEELLDLARYARGTFKLKTQPIDLNQFIEEVVSRYAPSLDKTGQQLIIEAPSNLPVARIDSSRMEQVLVNLLSNATKYSQGKGRIIFTAGIRDDELLIQVQDFGIGISAEDQVRLFQPYHRVEQDRQRFPGIGLGLAVCKQIVEAHHGKIWVTSQPGQGSTFCLQIPLSQNN